MAIRPELSADRERGPGYGRLRVSGWRSTDPIRFALQRNRASEPFLGKEQTESCPVNDRLCSQAVWFTQTMLLDTKQGMDQIAQAIRKIEGSADKISRA